MSSMPYQKLGEVASFVRGITFKPDDVVDINNSTAVACLRTKNVQKDLDLSDIWGIPESFVKREDQFVREGDIIVSTANSWNLVGKCCWTSKLPWKTTLGGFISALRGNDNIDNRYLYHWFSSDPVQALVRTCARRTTSIANLSFDQCLNLDVPLPLLKHQKRIAAILDQADELRRARHKSIELLNDLSLAIFYEMFGNPDSNPKGFAKGKIRDLVKEVKYGTSQKAHTENNGLPILRMGNITYEGQLDLSDLKYVDLGSKDISKYTAVKDDILFNRTNSKELVGKTAVFNLNEPYAIAGYLVRARVNDKADPYYISGYLNSPHGKTVLMAMCKNIVGMANINAQEFQDIDILIPPLDLQKKYRETINSMFQRREEISASLETMNSLFISLQNKAFSGEL